MRTQASCGSRPRRRSGTCAPAARPRCGSAGSELDSFAKIVADYRRHYDDHVAADRAFFGDHELAPAAAVRRACLSLQPDGTLHPHQRRLGRQRMAGGAVAMAPFVAALMEASDFAALHRTIDVQLRAVGGFGELAIYDIAQRIGWYRRLEPAEIYLHRGTRDGARLLVPGLAGATLSPARLPPEFHALTPPQLEDVLCIYKAQIGRIAGLRRSPTPPR